MTRDSDREARDRSAPAGHSQWKELTTEARHPGSLLLDTQSTAEVVSLLLEEDRVGLERALQVRREIALAADWVAETLGAGGDVLLIGAGTSGRLGVMEAAECPPTFGTDPQRIRGVIAGGDEAVFRAQEGAEDRSRDGRRVGETASRGDLVIGLSASSVTAYVRGALEGARSAPARTVLLTCAAAEGLDHLADLVIGLDTGPEILTGSTRLKAGSATKAALNAITTAAMVRTGKVFENLMVDLRPGSAKLRDRALRIIATAGGVTAAEAEELYLAAGGEVKTAIVMARCRIPVDRARERLAQAAGRVRGALDDGTDHSAARPASETER